MRDTDVAKMLVEIEPNDGPTVMDLGKSYYRNRDYENALYYFNESEPLMPEYEWVYIWIGRSLVRLNKYDDASAYYNKAVRIDPGFIQSYIGLGDLEVSRNRNTEAAGYYRKVLEINPDHTSTIRKLDKLQ